MELIAVMKLPVWNHVTMEEWGNMSQVFMAFWQTPEQVSDLIGLGWLRARFQHFLPTICQRSVKPGQQ